MIKSRCNIEITNGSGRNKGISGQDDFLRGDLGNGASRLNR